MGKVVTVAVGTTRPVRDPQHLARLFGEHLDKLDLGFGADVMALFVTESNLLEADQLRLRNQGTNARFHKPAPTPPSRPILSAADVESAIGGLTEPTSAPWNQTADLSTLSDAEVKAAIDRLTDRIGNRLGADNVVRFAPQASHLPERSVRAFSPLAVQPDIASQPDATVDIEIPWLRGLPRPLCLFLRPEPVEAVAPIPDDPPVLFRWRRQLHRVAWAEGPERLGAEWWREAGLSAMPEPLPARDYFRVEDTAGRRFWLYRNGLYRQSAAAPILVVTDRDAEPEKPHSYERRQLTAVPKHKSPDLPQPGDARKSARPAPPVENAPTWFVHGIFG